MNDENKILVILTPGFPESEADSTCLPMQQHFVKALKENNPHIKIIILSFHYPYHKKKYEWFGIPVISLGGKNKGGLITFMLREKANAALKKINSDNKISAILSFWYGECALAGHRFAEQNHIIHYCWILGQDARKGNKYIKKAGLKAGELIALSDFLQDEFEKNYGRRPLHVIMPGVNTISADTDITKRDIDILGAGSLIPLKQFDIFMKMIFEIKKQMPAVKVMLIGEGPEKKSLQDLITKYDLHQNIELTGQLPHDDVLKMMQRSKVLLHPSSYEGFSGVCQEALSAGAQVVSFCRAMNYEIENWHIVTDKEEMKNKTIFILQNTDEYHPPGSVFSIDDTAKTFASLI
jgi:glycosyltransferase involved in cell wall biosynthesis